MNFAQVEIKSRQEWRDWLSANLDQTESIWLVTYKKGRGPYVSYDEQVEEALCFGWVDSRVAKLDADRTMLLMSPRRPESAWSALNKSRIAKMQNAGLMHPRGQAMVDLAKQSGTWDKLNEVDALIEPTDLLAALDAVAYAKENWALMSPSSRRGILEWILAAKRAETRKQRIAATARLAGQGRKANFPAGRDAIAGAVGPQDSAHPAA